MNSHQSFNPRRALHMRYKASAFKIEEVGTKNQQSVKTGKTQKDAKFNHGDASYLASRSSISRIVISAQKMRLYNQNGAHP